MNRVVFAGYALLMLTFLSPLVAEESSPFSAVRWVGSKPEVQFDDTWYEPVSIHGQSVTEILEFCRARYREKWDKRFCEDLVRVLSEMGHPPGKRVALRLKDLRSGKTRLIPKARMSVENRQAIRRASPRARETTAPVNRVERKHKARPDGDYSQLVVRYWEGRDRRDHLLPEKAMEDLDQFEWHLENTFSYLGWRPIDYRSALDTIRASLGAGIHRYDFHIQLRKFLALFGDGHSRVRGIARALPPGFAPARFADLGDRVAALQLEERKLLDPERPYVVAMDGVPIQEWLSVASAFGAQGSPQFIRREAIFYLSWIQALRKDLELSQKRKLRLTLADRELKNTKVVSLDLTDRPGWVSPVVPQEHRRYDGGIAYLRIESMSLGPLELDALQSAMESYSDASAFILDVRGNGGGNRRALRLLFPYFMSREEPPQVVNVAALRVAPGSDAKGASALLADRFCYPDGSGEWGRDERRAIREVSRRFKAEWKFDEKKFSDWCYLVLGPRKGVTPETAREVVLLIDGAGYSATDIFVGAFQGRGNVTLVGTPTGGGSGRGREFTLAHSGLGVVLSTMASYRSDGRMYDGNGIQPDVLVPVTLEDYLGTTDGALSRGLDRLRSARARGQ